METDREPEHTFPLLGADQWLLRQALEAGGFKITSTAHGNGLVEDESGRIRAVMVRQRRA